jgi:O-antigen/teichoic acid export membrane protein
MHENGQWMAGEQMSPDARNGNHNRRSTSAKATRFDDVVIADLPTVEMPRMLASLELRNTPMLFLPSQMVTDSTWIEEQPTWMLPAIPKSVTADQQASSPPAQSTTTKKEQTGASGQNYLSLALDMVKNSGIYAVGALMSPLVSLILTPFLTHNLSNDAYGGLAVLYTVVDLVTIATQLGLSRAFFRAYNSDYDNARDRLNVLASTIIMLALASMPVAIAMIIAAPWLSEILFNTSSFSSAVALTALVIVAENLTLPGISWFRAEKRPGLYSALSILNLLVVLGTNIVLVGTLHMGVNGALIAKGAGYAAMIVFSVPMILLRLIRARSLHLRFDIVWSMLAFGVPTIFSDIAAWVLQLSDRYLLSHFGSLAETASYSVAYVLGGVLSPVILAPWGLAWVPIMYAVAKRDDAAHIFKLVFRWWSTVLLFAAFGLALLSTVVLETLFPPSYHAAEPVIPIITLSTMLMGVWYIFMIGVNIRRKTIYEFVYLVIAATVNLLLNLLFIPYFGAIGAAVSTLLAYGLLVFVSYTVNQRIYPVGFEVGGFTLKLIIGVTFYVGSSLLAHGEPPVISWSISIVTLLLYGVVLMALAGLSPRKIISVFGYVQAAIKKEWRKNRAKGKV